MTREQQWNRDTQLEHMAADFLDRYFYPTFDDKATVKRYTDTYHQFGGIDIAINATNFDEKAKIKGCLNEVLKNVGIECSILNKANRVQDGWFINDSLSTDYYAIIGLSASVPDDKQLESASQISAADVLWVKKSELKDFVYTYIEKDELKRNVERLREFGDSVENDTYGTYESMPTCLGFGKPKDGRYRTSYPHRKFWLTYSSRMKEQPVNIVVPRKTLESFPHSRHFIVTKEKVIKK